MPKFYKDVPGTKMYTHSYRCGCTVPNGKRWDDGWIVEESLNATPAYVKKQHFQIDNDARCQSYLKLAKTESRTGVARVEIPKEDYEWGFRLLQENARACGVPTAAVMWCNETRDWYYGKCRHGKDFPRQAPKKISETIIEKDKEKMPESDCYGKNCAEVYCVMSAYDNGRTGNDLSGCVFVARSIARGPLSACKTCRAWIKDLGGKYANYRQGSFESIV